MFILGVNKNLYFLKLSLLERSQSFFEGIKDGDRNIQYKSHTRNVIINDGEQ